MSHVRVNKSEDTSAEVVAATQTTQTTQTSALPLSHPATDAYRTESGIVMMLDLPGVEEKDLDIEMEDMRLTVSATAKPMVEDGLEWLHRESHGRTFQRSFRLNNRVEREKVSAKLKHGVLTIKLPFKAEVAPRKINVTVEG